MNAIGTTTTLLGAMLLSSTPAWGAENKPALSSSALISSTLFPDKVVARGQGVEVKQSQVDEAYLTFKANRAAMGQAVPDDLRTKIEGEILDKLIVTQLFLRRATDADRVKAKETGDRFIAEQMKQAPSAESFNRQLRAMGLTPEKFREQIGEQAIVQAVMDREVKLKKTISSAEAKAYYDTNPNVFFEPESVRVSHILFSTMNSATGRDLPEEQKQEKRRTVDKVLAEVKAGADFAASVRKYSEDQASRDRGGEYTIARSKDGRIRSDVPEFEAAAFTLPPDQISDVITTRFGYHIIKGGPKTPAKKIEFASVESRIIESLLREEAQKELPSLVEKMKREARVEILPSTGSK